MSHSPLNFLIFIIWLSLQNIAWPGKLGQFHDPRRIGRPGLQLLATLLSISNLVQRTDLLSHAVADLLRRAGVGSTDYQNQGIFVLRATVMSPYIVLSKENDRRKSYLAEFMAQLGQEIDTALAALHVPVGATPRNSPTQERESIKFRI